MNNHAFLSPPYPNTLHPMINIFPILPVPLSPLRGLDSIDVIRSIRIDPLGMFPYPVNIGGVSA